MECTWDAALLQRTSELPPELLHVIQHGSTEEYLDAITVASLDCRYTYLVFAHCEPFYAHVLASLRKHTALASSIATLGRIVPFAPYLQPYAQGLLNEERYVFSTSCTSEDDLLYLLGLFRLLSNDWRTFKPFIRLGDLAPLLESSSRPIVYLTIRILQIHLSGADFWFEQMIERYLGADTPDSGISGAWDDKIIDYRFLTLWEEERFRRATKLSQEVQINIQRAKRTSCRTIPEPVFNVSTTLVGNWLLPRALGTADASDAPRDRIVQTSTTVTNLCSLASAIRSDQPIMVTGLPGSGKSMLIRHVARKLGKLEDMITLHLNEQSDTKLLVGIYTTGDTPGTFVWKAGVLTQAVREGRWVLIEDLDRAPKEVIGALLPLIEKGELLIPNKKQVLHAAPGFRIFATVRSNLNYRGEQTKPLAHTLGARHWHHVPIASPSIEEIGQISGQLFRPIATLLPQLMSVYEELHHFRHRKSMIGQTRTGVARDISPRDLFKWCQRVANFLHKKQTFTSRTLDDMFLEAIDCFAGSLPPGPTHNDMAATVAEKLNIDPQRRDHLLFEREAKYETTKQIVSVGRYSLPRAALQKDHKSPQESFSTNPHTCRMLERVAAAVVNREPMLLVGETGVGKTTAVQHLAHHLGKKLIAFNLSQQSEAGDLLGGFKPINMRSIVVPMKDEFDQLFSVGFSRSKNQQFLELIGKNLSKSNWKAVCKLWRQALKMVEQQRARVSARSDDVGEAPSKKRRIESSQALDYVRWDAFASKVYDLERRLASGSEALAFSFVEGSIVKAVRNGDWILLDEINLASPDTLEAIADLFDSDHASVLLTESGSVERIYAHPNFRVFAAMNPATDVGKKDLPPGIRSRFTELYVESPDKDIRSLQSIVKSYLRQDVTTDPAIASDVSVLYQKIIALAEGNQLVDGAGERPHFSLRTLTRTLSYAKHIAPLCNIRRALYEGLQMSFMTFLDAESTNSVEPLIKHHILGKRMNTNAELSRALREPDDGHAYVQGHPSSKHWIRRGKAATEEQAHYIITPFVRRNLENLIRATSTRKFSILLQGPTSTGKTSMIEYLAKRSGHTFVRINNHEHTDLQEYLGTYTSDTEGRLQYQDGVLVKALREGHWIVLDELNLAPTDVLEALNRLLDDNRELLIPETQEYIRPHDSFMLFATQNPAGLYGGRKPLSRAFRNRFLELHFDDIPIDELQEILHKRTQLPESRCRRIVGVYKELSVLRQESRMFEQRSFATLRDLFRWALRPNETIDQLATNGFMLLAERVRKQEERQLLKAIIEKVMRSNGPRVRIDEDALYAADNADIRQYQQPAAGRGVTWTRAMRRLYSLVARAVANNEPVLLVGETGCGKTTVCQMLADAFGKQLNTVNAHQNTETGDIIGSQRPIRNRAAIEADLRQQLLSCEILTSTSDFADQQTDKILSAYDREVAALPETEKRAWHGSRAHEDIQLSRTRFLALFEWVDGSLVHAMKSGDFFLLDEISLADDSVLERLNSVLESEHSITLAEKGSKASFVTAEPGFQFLATMNPGGDYGKRELSPALRNRFTEIWVPPLDDVEDVMLIVSSQLPERAKTFAAALVSFAQWFNERYNTSASSSISMRDVLSWVGFIAALPKLQVIDAVIHGACMVYIDALGANPAGLMSNSTKGVDEERKLCVEHLGKLLQGDASAVYFQPVDVRVVEGGLIAGSFSVPRGSASLPSSGSFSFEPLTTRTNAMRIVRAMQLPKPILLEGNPGVGKTALVTAIADAVGVPLTRINLSEQTDLLDLFGSDVPVEDSSTGTFAWRDASFLRAMKKGEWVLLDEMNLASQSVLEGLNACLDHRGEVFVPELGQSFLRHPSFRLFAAQNPHQQGGGRKGLPASFVNRFTVTYADAFRSLDLITISQRLFPSFDIAYIRSVVTFVEQLERETLNSKRIGASGGPWEFNLRDVSRWLSLASSQGGLLNSASVKDCVDCLFVQRFRSDRDRAFVNDLFGRTFGEQHRVSSDLYPSMSCHSLQIGVCISNRNQEIAPPQPLRPNWQWPSSHLASLQSIMICIQQNWPVILTGASRAGKTALIARLAAAVGAEMTTIALNADSDAMDLIGGFDQEDPQREASAWQATLYSRLNTFIRNRMAGHTSFELLTLSEENDIESLASRLSVVQASDHPLDPDEMSELQSLVRLVQGHDVRIQKAQFEWIDGLLVDALQQGKWLVLDNANLCSPSVLDRLNSLLEPNGTLIINEHSTDDGSPRIIRPHKNFRVFLTYDPRYGELSRAMRNRAVELHLPSDAEDTRFVLDPLHTESAMSRFRIPAFMGYTPLSPAGSTSMASVLADHVGLQDVALLPGFMAQLRSGLYSLPDQLLCDLDQAYSVASSAALQAVDIAPSSQRLVTSQSQASADYACVQTFHPLNNQALVFSSAAPIAHVYSTAYIYETLLQAGLDLASLNSISSDHAKVSHIRRAERSLNACGMPAHKVGGSFILEAVKIALRSLRNSLRSFNDRSSELDELRPLLRRAFAVWKNLTRHLGDHQVDATALLTYSISAGRALLNEVTRLSSDEAGSVVRSLEEFALCVATQQDQQLQTSILLWYAFHPAIATTRVHSEGLMRLESLMSNFDQVCWSFSQPFELTCELRRSFSRAFALAKSRGQSVWELTDSLTKMMEEHRLHSTGDGDNRVPHFIHTFQHMLDRFSLLKLAGATEESADLSALEMFAMQKTIHSINLPREEGYPTPDATFQILKSIAQRVVVRSDEGSNGTASLARELSLISEVGLSRMDLLGNELRVLGKTIASHSDELCKNNVMLARGLQHLVQSVFSALKDAGSHTLALHSERLLDLPIGIEEGSARRQGSIDPNNSICSAWTRLDRVTEYCRAARGCTNDDPNRTADAWAMFALSCLEIYIPTLPIDPALYVQFQQGIHTTIQQHLADQVEALTAVRAALTGTVDTIRIRMLQEEIATYGNTTPQAVVKRPLVSKFGDLRTDLDALMRVTGPLRLEKLSLSAHLPLNESVLTNIIRIRTRLETAYREYDDVVQPVLGFIDCLLLAHTLARIEDDGAEEQCLSQIVPFAGAHRGRWTSGESFQESASRLQTWRERLLWLRALALHRSIVRNDDEQVDLLSIAEQQFQQFYLQWNVELGQGQKQQAAKSNLYKFKGQEDTDEELTLEELDELFPGEYSIGASTETASRQKAQDQAHLVTDVHASLFSTEDAPESSMVDLLTYWSANGPESSISDNTLPAFVLRIKDLQLKLSGEEPGRNYNIYKDVNAQQARFLLTLIHKIMQRFRTLHEQFQDMHTKPQEVLELCERLLQVSHATPLSQILPHIEKLYAAVSEWQVVASREYSVHDLIESLIDVVVRWRRLELSSWLGLFESERERSVQDAKAWWFVAYESIFAAFEGRSETAQELQDLLSALGGFLSTCGLGEWHTRLQILRNFEAHLAHHATTDVSFRRRHHAIRNLVTYHDHFSEKVKSALEKGCTELEGQVNGIVKVASWKDRNIEILKQSAKSSHKKLGRLARKLRRLLAQPVTSIITSDVPAYKEEAMVRDEPSAKQIQVSGGPGPGHVPQFEVWNERPMRFQNVAATSDLVQAKMSRLHDGLCEPDRLHIYVDEIRRAVVGLQKATPSILTEENKAIVKHLKTRKRRLLADVLRDVRKMGFHPTKNEQALARQNSTEVILASLPALWHSTALPDLREAENIFHRFLGLMPTARECGRNHSEELTPTEISRCLSLLESILGTTILQHKSAAAMTDEIGSLEQVMRQLRNFGHASSEAFASIEQRTHTDGDCRAAVLKPVLTTARKILDDQSSLASKEYPQLIQMLETSEARLDQLLVQKRAMSQLPSGVYSQSHRDLHDEFHLLQLDLEVSLNQQSDIHQEIGPVLAHVLRWTRSETKSLQTTEMNGNTEQKSEQWVENIFELIDSVLAKVQKVDKLTIESESGRSKEDLVKTQQHLCSVLDTLRPGDLAKGLNELQSQLAHLQLVPGESLSMLGSIVGAVFPILESYHSSLLDLLRLSGDWYLQLSRTGNALTTSFVEIAQNGFCSPSDKNDKSKSAGNVESGTGLGDGEGAEDISGDIGDDEDLSDLKNGEESGERSGDLEDEKDAVDMADEEFEGEVGDDLTEVEPEDGNGEGSGSEDDDQDGEAEQGDTGSDAVDEKMWDGGVEEGQPEKETEEKAGKPSDNEENAASKGQQNGEMTEEEDVVHSEDPDEIQDDGADPNAPEPMDQRVDEGDNLDLPDDFTMDGKDDLDDDFSSMGSDVVDDDPVDPERPQEADDLGRDERQDEQQADSSEETDVHEDVQDEQHAGEPIQEDTSPQSEVESEVNREDERHTVDDGADDPTATSDDRRGAEKDKVQDERTGAAHDGEIAVDDAESSETEETGAAKGGRDAKSGDAEQGETRPDQAEQEITSRYKQLGDILEKWYDQHRNIGASSDQKEETHKTQSEVDTSHFEHVPDEETDADTQALGASSMEHAAPIDRENAVELKDEKDMKMDTEQSASQDERVEGEDQIDNPDPNVTSSGPQESVPTSFIQEPRYQDKDIAMEDAFDEAMDDLQDMDEQLTNTHLSNEDLDDDISAEAAQQLWAKHEENTRNLALNLAEQLRLILHPTQATRMRGDFRTGKRLNIKKIIPYIASSYKRDKIWMRRSVPSKRSYQVMLAIDDSKSMCESNARDLAFDTLALVAKSLTILEVGNLSVVGFGDQVNVAHDFSAPFTSDNGSRMLQSLRFSQNKTDVQRLLAESIELFRDARLKAAGSASNLWQLELIISDGICEDHLAIRRLVRQAYEERIMVVFIVVDPAALTATQTDGRKQSILDLQTAEFVKDADGEMQLKMTKYLDTFPFRHYLIVRDVQDLPGVLAGALRQWFAETMEASG